MEASVPSPVEAARDHYQYTVREIEQTFAETYAQVDGDYSRITQYAGLLRDELLTAAKRRRVLGLETAKSEFEVAVHQLAGTSPPPPPPPDGPVAVQPPLPEGSAHDPTSP